MAPQIVLYGYPTSPYTQKLEYTLKHLSLPYSYCLQPRVLPRPDLASLGVAYRRMPILSIDGDIYCDTSIIISKLCSLAGVPNAVEYAAIGDNLFPLVVGTIPPQYLAAAGEGFIADREDMIGGKWDLEAQGKNRPATLSQLVAYASIIEKEFLQGGRKAFFTGDKIAVADIHVFFVFYWGIAMLQAGHGIIEKETHPVLFKWLDSVKAAVVGEKEEKVDFATAKKILEQGEKVVVTSSADPLGLKDGEQVSVVPTDNSRNHPTSGKLVALTPEEVVLETKEGFRVHFPRLKFAIYAS